MSEIIKRMENFDYIDGPEQDPYEMIEIGISEIKRQGTRIAELEQALREAIELYANDVADYDEVDDINFGMKNLDKLRKIAGNKDG